MGTSTTGYVVSTAKTPVVDGNALLHIIIASLAAGAGLAIAFGFILYGWEFIQEGKSAAIKAGGWLMGLAAAAFCVFAIVVGIYVMTHPPKTKPLKVTAKSSAQVSGISRPAA